MLATLLAMPSATLWAFLAGAVLLNLTPGADVLFATASGVQGGPKAGAAAGLGVGLGGVFHTLLTAFGLGALVAAHPGVLQAVRWLGAGYLLWLAWQAWRAHGSDAVSARGAISPGQAFWRGVVINMGNPKVLLFMLAYLPQFTDAAVGPVWQQMVILGAMMLCTGMVITTAYGIVAGWLGGRLASRMGGLNKLAAVLFGALAAKLVLD